MKAVFYTILLLWAISTQAATYMVNSSFDTDVCDQNTCTLRGAINAALAAPGNDTISFNIPADAINENYFTGGNGADVYFYWLIQPTAELPELQDITLDGSSAGVSEAGNPTIVLDGSLAGSGTSQNPMDGLTLLGDVTVTGLAVVNWEKAGISMASGTNNQVAHCWSGLELPYGLDAAPNSTGVMLLGGQNLVVHENIIAGNDDYGIFIDSNAADVEVANNRMGIGVNGDALSTGIAVYSSGANNVLIGPDNHIANNRRGVQVVGFNSGNTHVFRNQIHDNDFLGIDLGVLGFTANDSQDLDEGPNNYQNFPDLQSAQHDPSGNRINFSYVVDSSTAASDYPITVDVYAADGIGQEGQTWLASTTFTAEQYQSGAPVFVTLSADEQVAVGDTIVATATDAAGRTSEFSVGFVLGGDADFSIACQTKQITTTSALTCSLNCQAEAVNGWGDEAQLQCTNPDSSCNFLPSDEISFVNPVVPIVLEINHAADSPGIYASEVLASSEVSGGTVQRQAILTIKQLADDDYVFSSGFDGVICQ